MKQFVLTPAMGKRLIGKAMATHPAITAALADNTVVIVAGTTNGYVAEEILTATGQQNGFSRTGFRRGAVMAPGFDASSLKTEFKGDVVLVKGAWQKGKEIFDVVNDLKAGDVIVKGANAVDLCTGRTALLIGHPMGGTIGAALPAIVGRRVQLIIPVGLEKRVCGGLDEMADMLNAPTATGPRLVVMPGRAFTELDAIAQLTGAKATLVAAGGIHGAEGAVWIVVRGTASQEQAAEQLVKGLATEGLCQV